MEEYKGNSNKAKEQQKALPPEKKVEKIVSGPVKSKKKNSIQKITSIFVPEDVEDVKSYIFEDIVVPAVKDIILDAVRALLGVSGKSNKGHLHLKFRIEVIMTVETSVTIMAVREHELDTITTISF